MSDQTTISSVDDSITNLPVDLTTTTTPPLDDLSFTKSDAKTSSANISTVSTEIIPENATASFTLSRSGFAGADASGVASDLDDINGVLYNLNLDMEEEGRNANTDKSNNGSKSSSIFQSQFSPYNGPTNISNTSFYEQKSSSSANNGANLNKGPTTPPSNSYGLANTYAVSGSNDQFNGFLSGQPRTPNWSTANNGLSAQGAFVQSPFIPELSATPIQPVQQQQYFDGQRTSTSGATTGTTNSNSDASSNSRVVSMTPNSSFAQFKSGQSTPFNNYNATNNVPTSAPPVRRNTSVSLTTNVTPFSLPIDGSNSGANQIETSVPVGSSTATSTTTTTATGTGISLSSSTPKAEPVNFGAPLIAANTPKDTNRRLTYPSTSPNEYQQVKLDQAISALHPALTNDMLSGTVAGGSMNGGSSLGAAAVLATNANAAPINDPMLVQNGFFNPMSMNANDGLIGQQIPMFGANGNLGFPPNDGFIPDVSKSMNYGGVPGGFNPYGFARGNGPFSGGFNSVTDYRGQGNLSNSGTPGNMMMQGNAGQQQRSNLGANTTANVHRKHSSNKRRGEDASKFVNASLDDFTNEIYFLCKDQHGCRFLQKQLELNGAEAATKIFNEIQLNVIELMIDPFGNYLIQKLLERINDEQRTTFVHNASAQFVRIALDPHGTRALQKLVECINTPAEFQIIVNSLSSYVVLLSRDLNGNHVIQKCLQKLPAESCDFIFDAACENCVKIAKHRHGCCVLQRCFDHGTAEQCERLSSCVGANAVELSVDPYGNYVVQYVLSMEENRLRTINDPRANKVANTETAIHSIVDTLKDSLPRLSTHKFGSNVVEKSLRIPTLAPILIKSLLKDPQSLDILLHDAYGNYVLQTALDVADDASFKELSESLKPSLADVKNTPHGRRILGRLISRGGASSGIGNQSSSNSEGRNTFGSNASQNHNGGFSLNSSNYNNSNIRRNDNGSSSLDQDINTYNTVNPMKGYPY